MPWYLHRNMKETKKNKTVRKRELYRSPDLSYHFKAMINGSSYFLDIQLWLFQHWKSILLTEEPRNLFSCFDPLTNHAMPLLETHNLFRCFVCQFDSSFNSLCVIRVIWDAEWCFFKSFDLLI